MLAPVTGANVSFQPSVPVPVTWLGSGVLADDKVKLRPVEWILVVHLCWCPHKRGNVGPDRDTHTGWAAWRQEECTYKQRGAVHEERGEAGTESQAQPSEGTGTAHTSGSDLRPWDCETLHFCSEASSSWYFVRAAPGH